MDLINKTAVVTGASSGLGKAISRALVKKGTRVFGIARNQEKLDQLQKDLGDLFIPVALDITQETMLRTWAKSQFNQEYAPDILIYNAGSGSFHKVDETETSIWLNTMDVNLNGMFYITSELAGLMKQKGSHCHILNIGSILGKVGRIDGTAYCTAKFGVQGFSEALRLELRHFKIKVTCIHPGSIATDFFQTSGIRPHDNMLHSEDIAQTIVHVLETPDNMLIDEIIMRPLDPRAPR